MAAKQYHFVKESERGAASAPLSFRIFIFADQKRALRGKLCYNVFYGKAGEKMGIDHMWILICACFIFFLQAGFVCYEVGFVQSKNVISVAMELFGKYSYVHMRHKAADFHRQPFYMEI